MLTLLENEDECEHLYRILKDSHSTANLKLIIYSKSQLEHVDNIILLRSGININKARLGAVERREARESRERELLATGRLHYLQNSLYCTTEPFLHFFNIFKVRARVRVYTSILYDYDYGSSLYHSQPLSFIYFIYFIRYDKKTVCKITPVTYYSSATV